MFIVAFLHSLVLRPTDIAVRREQSEAGFVACPFCAEMVRPQAIVCQHCGRDLAEADPRDDWSPDTDEAADRAWREVDDHG